MKKIFGGILLSGLIFIAGCEKKSYNDTGFLEGKISIGPLCPVERIPPDPNCLPTAETYKAYPVSVWSSDGRREIARLNPALDGTYDLKLLPGNYLVMLVKNQGPGGSNLPVDISINTNDTTILNINIDTGIR